ncbi:hypothetical protein CA54_14190 [Symmachiella macrocystis]|uniref:Uncharacterized protein n=1 Tax=Symmachiella macrocystis TaxID=2527985 RepID=A0A5C6BKU6_9PLAN|nr:hypothetical protein [Symmachiella macrocystis]TWU12595.1 hypothetical protein CA54_14190 [Symmachiella macrocystis]
MLDSILNLLGAFWSVLSEIGGVLTPWIPLIAWCVFWLFAVNWSKLRVVLRGGGWIALLLICAAAVLVWGSVAPGTHDFGIPGEDYAGNSNFVGKTVYVTGLLCIMLLCGAVQNSGACDRFCNFSDDLDEEPADAAHH